MKISTIIDKINEKLLLVPAFQREYVWQKKDVKHFLSSLIRDYPIGTMLTWETFNPPELKGSYVKNMNPNRVKLILDGQQRITTLYMLMTGNIPPYYTEPDIKKDIRGLYVNILEQNMEQHLEYFKASTMKKNHKWVDITKLFKREIRSGDIENDLKSQGKILSREEEDLMYKNIEKIRDIERCEFLEQEVPDKATLREAIDIFHLVNSTGTRVTTSELALAQISAYWPQARGVFKEKCEQLKQKGWSFKLDFIVDLLTAIIHTTTDVTKLHDEINKKKIKEAWTKLEGKTLDSTIALLQSDAFIDSTDEITSLSALIPIITYIYYKDTLVGEERGKLVKWFFYSQIRSRYVNQSNTKLNHDLKEVVKLSSISPFDTLLTVIGNARSLKIEASEFIGSTKIKKNALFNLMRCYFRRVDARCLGSGGKLARLSSKTGNQWEVDHIFAKSLLKKEYDLPLINEISNKALLIKEENRKKSATLPSVYLKSALKNHPQALELQCIPKDENLWELNHYEKFLEARRVLLAQGLNQFLEDLSSTPKGIIIEENIEDVIEEGEGQILEFKSSLRWNYQNSKEDTKLETAILKTIAAFSNQEGGRLLIGVQDDGEILGLKEDYNTLKEGSDKECFQRHLIQIIKQAFKDAFTASNICIKFYEVEEKEICEVKVEEGNSELYLEVMDKHGKKESQFYVRMGNTSTPLPIQEAMKFIKSRF